MGCYLVCCAVLFGLVRFGLVTSSNVLCCAVFLTKEICYENNQRFTTDV